MKTLILLLLIFTSCARIPVEEPSLAMRPIQSDLELKDDLNLEDFQKGLKIHIKILLKDPARVLNFGGMKTFAKDYAFALEKLLAFRDKEKLLAHIKKDFIIHEVYGKKSWGEILLTSYYEPIYPARQRPTDKYSQPLYKLPPDLVEIDMSGFSVPGIGDFETDRTKVSGRITHKGLPFPKIVPHYSREEIDIEKKLSGQGLELYYLDPIHSFFLQIQGSGVLELPNKKRIRVGYAGQNGWIYESIGKHLFHVIPKEEMSLQRIEKHLRTLGKEELLDFLKINPSYVFFKRLKGRGLTTFGNEVVPGRTLAVDSSLFPLGALGYLSFQKPFFVDDSVEVPTSYEETSRLVLAQDTGGAIKSTGRADLFWGEGDEALRYAGTMRHSAKLWFLIPRR
jgi:membrane-bound lytic murein transglycosylase A